MINGKELIYSTLSGDADLIALLGGDNIFSSDKDGEMELPCVTYYEQNNIPSLTGDDRELASEIIMQIDVWSGESVAPIVSRVNEILQGQGWKRLMAMDMTEEGVFPKVFRKTLQYSIKRGVA